MGFSKFLKRGRVFDQCFGDDSLRKLAGRLKKSDFAAVGLALDSRPDAWFISQVLLTEEIGVSLDIFSAWVEQAPSARSFAHLGAAQVRHAWQIRGSGFADTVDPDVWQDFFQVLELAEDTLQQGSCLDPHSVDPLVPLLTSGKGLSLEKDDLAQRFSQVQSRSPFRPDACRSMLQVLCQKWHGSHEEMFNFARWVDASAPADSAARSCLPMAHIERVLVDEDLDEDKYFESIEVSQELVMGCERYLSAVPLVPDACQLETLNLYLYAIPINSVPVARLMQECIRRIKGRPSEYPWVYFYRTVPEGFASRLRLREAEIEELV